DGVLLLERDGLYGYYSIEGRWIAQPIFTFARPFAEGLGVIGFANGIKGVIDTEGNVVIPFEYEEISQVSTGIIAAYSETIGNWQFFGKVAKTVE
ncbi:MAG: WG repeat-containing protein, partial [Clostridia bacterium]|nr:WG repeat-containing protein [Clostridia bacterium]